MIIMDNKKYITPDELKSLLLDLLCEFDSFCKNNGIRYYLIGGTLLGAIRHKGFIPWDDDIDVCVFREDYEKLLSIYKSSNPNYSLISMKSDKKYYYPFAKLVNTSTVLVEEGQEKNPLGVYLDIFPIDNCPGKTLEEACRNVDKMDFYRWMRNFKIITFDKRRKWYKNLILAVGKIITFPFSRRTISELIERKAIENINLDCQYVGELVNTAYGYGEVYDKSHFAEGVEVYFEGKKFVAPKDYDYILTSMYKDYMKLPPIEKRISNHNSKCWYK